LAVNLEFLTYFDAKLVSDTKLMSLYNPFPGLRPFNAEESHLFFGRERHLNEIVRKLNKYRFVSIVGTSGSGKSSLVRAGLLPRLQKSDTDWQIAIMRPGENPIHELYDAISQHRGNPIGKEKEETEVLVKNHLGLVQLLRGHVSSDKPMLLLVDQFEEIFRYQVAQTDKEKRSDKQFIELILGAVGQSDVPIHVVLTIRSDFLGDCEQFLGLPEAINDGQFLIPRMNRDEIGKSISGPIAESGSKISPRLVQQLVNEVGSNPDQLPILQHVLMRTWIRWYEEGNHNEPIDLQHYEATGGMAKALSNHAEEAYADLRKGKQRDLATHLFKTITVKGPDNRGVRRPTTVETVSKIADSSPDEIIDVANVFRKEGRGFIMPPHTIKLSDESILDISHESLMRVWDRLREWVDEEGDSADLYQRITNNALLYENDKAGLWRDPDLQIAVDWRERQKPNAAWAEQYNAHFNTATRFIEASENEKRYMLAEKVRRKRITNAALIAFLLALSVLSIWAVSERNNAAQSATEAIAEKLKADEQKKIAEGERTRAEANYQKAKEEEQKALSQQIEKEEQRKIALQRAEEARIARLVAEEQSQKAIVAKSQAERDRIIADKQRVISDSLRVKSEYAEKQSKKLRILSLSQNIAIKSRMTDATKSDKEVKSLLALQAIKFHRENGGKYFDAEMSGALFSAFRSHQARSSYEHKYHRDDVKSVSYNKVTGDLASTGDDGRIIISNAYDMSKASVSSAENRDWLFANIDYQKGGNSIAVSCDDNIIYLFDPNNVKEKPIQIKNLHKRKVMSMQWYGDKIVTASFDSLIRIIDVNSSKVTKSFKLPSRPNAFDIHAGSGSIVVGCQDGSIHSGNLNSGTKLREIARVRQSNVSCVSINHNATRFAIGSGDGYCGVYTLGTGNGSLISVLSGHVTGVMNLEFHPNSNLLATACRDKFVRIYNTDDVNSPPIIFNEHKDWVNDVAWSPNGKKLASASKDRSVLVYPVDVEDMIAFIEKNVSRNFTEKEWNNYIGSDITYQKTISGIQ